MKRVMDLIRTIIHKADSFLPHTIAWIILGALTGLVVTTTAHATFYRYGALEDFFVIGIDAQPAASFAKWKERGINTIVRTAGDNPDEIDATAVKLGLKVIRNARQPSSRDRGQTHLLASNSPSDEPEVKFKDYVSGCAAQFAYQQAAAESRLPFFTNYAGAWMLGDPSNERDYCGLEGDKIGPHCYGEYFRATDWISFDYYPVNWNDSINSPRIIMEKIAADFMTNGQPLPPRLVYVEASDFDCSGPAPNEGQVVYEAVQAVIAGARGIIYFPHKVEPCPVADRTPDGTTKAIQREMTRLNRVLSMIPARTLQGWVNPDGAFFESGSARGQIIWGTRKDSTYVYYLTANDSDTSEYAQVVRFRGIKESTCEGKTVTVLNDNMTGDNRFTDRIFQLDAECRSTVPEAWLPRQYHIYKIRINE